MWLNYFKLIFRTFYRNKYLSLINIIGLSIGISSFLLIMFYIDYEYSFDNYQPDVDRSFRICQVLNTLNNNDLFGGTPAPLAPLLKENFPEIESICRVSKSSWNYRIKTQYEHHNFYERNCYLVDSTFFDFFECELVNGTINAFFKHPNNIAISELTAEKYFKDVDAIGKILLVGDNKPFIVQAVFKRDQVNTHLPFDILIPFARIEDFVGGKMNSWGESNYFTYLKIAKNSKIDELNKKIKVESEKYNGSVKNRLDKIFFQPVRKIHLENIRGNIQPIANLKYLYIYLGIGLFIFIVAIINFMNLITTSFMRRAKEVGLRKVMGAHFKRIVAQFMFETYILTLFSIFISIVFVESFIPIVNNFFNIDINITYTTPKFLILLFGILISVGTLSGSYPSFYISKLNPSIVLKNGFKASKQNTWIKNALVIFQFSIAISMIIGTLVILLQMNYLNSKDLGYDRKNILNIVCKDDQIRSKFPVLKQQFLQQPDFIEVSANSFLPSNRPYYQDIQWDGQEADQELMMWNIYADENFLSTFEIELLEGRNFTSLPQDVRDAYLINESAAKELGWDQPIGKMVSAWGNKHKGRVIGLIKDFNFRSLQFPVEPCLFHTNLNMCDYLSVKFKDGHYRECVEKAEEIWAEVLPNFPIEYFTVESDFDNIYSAEIKTGKMASYFAFLTILISCTGLFALVMVSTQQRMKEISIRKVYGATVSNILRLVFIDYGKLVLIANIIAWPCTYYFLSKWLQNFEYRIENYLWVFPLASLIILLISYVTILSQSLKVAKTNPAETLKFE